MSLDSAMTYKAYDKEEIVFGIERMPGQIRIAWEGTRALKLPAAYKKCANVVIVGMGGSAFAPELCKSVFTDRLTVPVEVVRSYSVPAYTSSNTLVILSSFSGTTEEVLFAAREAKKTNAKIVALSTGGKLLAFAKRNKLPHYAFEPGDLAKQPRLGVGYMMIGTLGILERAGFIKVKAGEISDMISSMSEVVDACALDVPAKINPAKVVAQELKDRAVLIVASEHLVGNAHAMSNQINENAKQFADFMEVSELNHHLMEGLAYPKKFFEKFTVLMIRSELYHPRIQKRYDITAEVFEKQGARVVDYCAGGGSKLEEAGEVLQFGSFMSYYLAMLNRVNPEEIPFVDWFKKKMQK
ncbi:MAG: bifunctional phosphoglucose/phosphomannose isomerase [bacterium]